jgi:rod shape-determining protein MreC
VSLRDGPLNDIKPPLTWLAAAAIVAALVVSLMVFVSGQRADPRGPLSSARKGAEGVMSDATGVLSAPIHWIGQAVDFGRDYMLAGQQNHELRRELAQDRALRDEVAALREVNARYRALLGVSTEPPLPHVFARTVLDARGPFANTRIADAGSDRGVIEGNPVLSEHGLVGRVTGVGDHVSRIMLLTDVESRTPVLIARTNGRAILTGDGGPNPKLDYLRTHDALREGDRVLTSGDGGVLPRGLPVGVAVKAYDGGWRVALDSDAAPIDFVQILIFKDFSQLLPPKALDPSVLPPVDAAPQSAAASPATAAPTQTQTPSAPNPPAPNPPAANPPAKADGKDTP